MYKLYYELIKLGRRVSKPEKLCLYNINCLGSMPIKINMVQTNTLFVMLYGSQTWTFKSRTEKQFLQF